MSKGDSGLFTGTSGEGKALINEVESLAFRINSEDLIGITKNIETSNISDFVLTAVSKGKIVGYQGKGDGRPIYEVEYNGEMHRVAITVASNGYIVGANPKS